MATITLTIPDDKVAVVLDAFAWRYGYQAMVAGEDGEPVQNPETKEAFAKRMLRAYLVNLVNAYYRAQAEVGADAQTATDTAGIEAT